MNSFRIWMACLIAAASRATNASVDLKATEAAEITSEYGESSCGAPFWCVLKERKAGDIAVLPDADLGYSIETAHWSDEGFTGDRKVDAILRNTDFDTQMRILEMIEAQ